MNLLAFLLGMAAALKRQWLSLLPEAVRQAQAAAPVSGPAYSVDWFSIDGGGGSSAGGNFSLSATIGQADAGASTGGNYTLLGAFLPGALKPVNQYIPLVRK